MIPRDTFAEPQSQWRVQSCGPSQQRLMSLCWWLPPQFRLQTFPAQFSDSLQSCFICSTTLPIKQMKCCCHRNEHISSFRPPLCSPLTLLMLVAFYLFSLTVILPVYVWWFYLCCLFTQVRPEGILQAYLISESTDRITALRNINLSGKHL